MCTSRWVEAACDYTHCVVGGGALIVGQSRLCVKSTHLHVGCLRESNTRPKWVAVTKCGSRPPRSQRDWRAASSSRTLRVTQIINPADTYPRRAPPPRIHSHIALLRHRSNSSCFCLPGVKNRFLRVRAAVFRGENHASLRSQDRERMRDLTQFLPLREYWQALIKKHSDQIQRCRVCLCDRFNGGNYFTQAPSVLRNSLGGANLCHKWKKSQIGFEESQSFQYQVKNWMVYRINALDLDCICQIENSWNWLLC